jgi:hypothetical protein
MGSRIKDNQMAAPYRSTPSIGQTFNERCSWFGFAPGWVDHDDNGKNASGLPQSVPGIAVYCRATLNHYWRVTFPNGFVHVVKQVDIGPAPYTHRGIDINASLANLAGYRPNNFPTSSLVKFTYLGTSMPTAPTPPASTPVA